MYWGEVNECDAVISAEYAVLNGQIISHQLVPYLYRVHDE